MSEDFQIRPGAIYQKQEPVRDPVYLKFLRGFPCVGCGRLRWGMEAMHTGPHALGEKASDLDALPGCPKCHRELHRIGPVNFQEERGIEFEALRVLFRRLFRLKHPAHPSGSAGRNLPFRLEGLRTASVERAAHLVGGVAPDWEIPSALGFGSNIQQRHIREVARSARAIARGDS
jgi:hypothetical protein